MDLKPENEVNFKLKERQIEGTMNRSRKMNLSYEENLI